MMHTADNAPGGVGGEFEIVITDDGRVIFSTTTAEMLELARTLAPDDPWLQPRGPRARGAHEREANENRATRRD